MSNAIKIDDMYIRASAIVSFQAFGREASEGRKNSDILYTLVNNPEGFKSNYMTKEEVDKISKQILDAWEDEGK